MSDMNQIEMSQQQIQAALEAYLNEHVLKNKVNVTSVTAMSQGCGTAPSFTIRISTTDVDSDKA